MITYAQFRPTACDAKGLGLEERQHWLVVPVSESRDSGALERSNFRTAQKSLPNAERHEFGHWACGWFAILLVEPDTADAKAAEEIECALADYPVLCDEDFSELEEEDARETWANCYTDASRLEYIRENRSQFEFRNLADMIACVRGKYFAGDASDLLA